MRGLKLRAQAESEYEAASHLLQMRGLKPQFSATPKRKTKSHLLQMRGLKLLDELEEIGDKVASFTDAWIETLSDEDVKVLFKSHLLQMRGLKRIFALQRIEPILSHLLQMRGLKLRKRIRFIDETGVASFTDAWIET